MHDVRQLRLPWPDFEFSTAGVPLATALRIGRQSAQSRLYCRWIHLSMPS